MPNTTKYNNLKYFCRGNYYCESIDKERFSRLDSILSSLFELNENNILIGADIKMIDNDLIISSGILLQKNGYFFINNRKVPLDLERLREGYIMEVYVDLEKNNCDSYKWHYNSKTDKKIDENHTVCKVFMKKEEIILINYINKNNFSWPKHFNLLDFASIFIERDKNG